MVKIIAHRGLLNGPNKELENRPEQIVQALAYGFDVEVDIWWEDGWFLGHDGPRYVFDENLFQNTNLWFHAKNLDALFKMVNIGNITCFWHENDCHTLTSNNYIWSYPGQPVTAKSIMVQNELHDYSAVHKLKPFAVCTDYALAYNNYFKGL